MDEWHRLILIMAAHFEAALAASDGTINGCVLLADNEWEHEDDPLERYVAPPRYPTPSCG
eukprot:scaffold32972_cov28-Tisochrysis_lutea.AAC.9